MRLRWLCTLGVSVSPNASIFSARFFDLNNNTHIKWEMRRWPRERKKKKLPQSQKGNIKVNIVKILLEIYVSCLLSDNPNVPGDTHTDTTPIATENKFRNMQTLEFTIMNITLLVAFGIVAHSVVCPTLWTITLCVFAHLANVRSARQAIGLFSQHNNTHSFSYTLTHSFVHFPCVRRFKGTTVAAVVVQQTKHQLKFHSCNRQ